MAEADIGLVGLAVMGSNLALNIAERGYRIAVHNRTASRIDQFVAGAGDLADRIVPCVDLPELLAAVKRPRSILVLVQAGPPVDAVLDALVPLLEPGDAILECGNSLYSETERRFAALRPLGIGYLGVGISGGAAGARHGPSIMVGGAKAQWRNVEPVLKDIAAKFEGVPCCAWLGEGGAGHFVKTVHNGIEYADMQMIAEIYGVMRDGLGMSPPACAEVFRAWNLGPLNSYLVEITAEVLSAVDAGTGRPLVELIRDEAGQKGTGRWSAIAAQELAEPATAIEGAVAARTLSARKAERVAAATAYEGSSGANVGVFVDMLEQALLAGKIAAYAQGFAVMAAASEERGWDLPLDEVAMIWRAGCIIRSRFLDDIARSYEKGSHTNLLMVPHFVELMRTAQAPLREVVAAGARAGIPLMCLSAALSYFDSYRQETGTANLIQGQRDYFGEHGFLIEGREGVQHGDWAAPDESERR